MVESPLTGVVDEVVAPEGARVAAGGTVLGVEPMKMHHNVVAPSAGVVRDLAGAAGDQVLEVQPLFAVAPHQEPTPHQGPHRGTAPRRVGGREPRGDLADVLARRRGILDEARPEAVGRRRASGRRTARENVADLCDPGSFSEYGGLAIAAQRRRRPEEELIARTPADGLVCGTAQVGGVPCVVLAYDY